MVLGAPPCAFPPTAAAATPSRRPARPRGSDLIFQIHRHPGCSSSEAGASAPPTQAVCLHHSAPHRATRTAWQRLMAALNPVRVWPASLHCGQARVPIWELVVSSLGPHSPASGIFLLSNLFLNGLLNQVCNNSRYALHDQARCLKEIVSK